MSGWVVAVAAVTVAQHALESQQPMVDAPVYEVDPFWPRPLPNQWVLGNAIGVGVDSKDHVFIVHRQDTMNDAENGAGTNLDLTRRSIERHRLEAANVDDDTSAVGEAFERVTAAPHRKRQGVLPDP